MTLSALKSSDWNPSLAAHLLNRAGFGGAPAAWQELADIGLDAAVDRLVNYADVPDTLDRLEWMRPDPNRRQQLFEQRRAFEEDRRRLRQEDARLQRERLIELRHWWLRRMRHSPRPLQEKLTFFWHGHFATSFVKVRDAYLMWRQNQLFREHATGSWSDMLNEVTRDPAMLLWLDQAASKVAKPNENYARELMELFTLGEGNFTEEDVGQAALALTGLQYDRVRQESFVDRRQHDNRKKTLFGHVGRFDGWDLIKRIVEHPQAAVFITTKLWRFLTGNSPDESLAQALAAEFRRVDHEFAPWLHSVLRSEAFYADNHRRNQIKSPVQWLVMACHHLERDLPAATVCDRMLRTLGQELFAPPNVKGWEDGPAWIQTNTWVARQDLAGQLIRSHPRSAHLFTLYNPNRSPSVPAETWVERLEERFLQDTWRPIARERLVTLVQELQPMDRSSWQRVLHHALSTPEYQIT